MDTHTRERSTSSNAPQDNEGQNPGSRFTGVPQMCTDFLCDPVLPSICITEEPFWMWAKSGALSFVFGKHRPCCHDTLVTRCWKATLLWKQKHCSGSGWADFVLGVVFEDRRLAFKNPSKTCLQACNWDGEKSESNPCHWRWKEGVLSTPTGGAPHWHGEGWNANIAL